jgi:alpha-1,2-mannosyltransferase
MMANRMPIMDCDEVYNYWEPLHFILYGSGQQTWEYAHEYALRTYAYLVPLQWLAPVLSRFVSPYAWLLSDYVVDTTLDTSKLSLFLSFRAFLAGTMALCELAWLYALHSRLSKDSSLVVGWTGVLLLTAAGMNHAAGAYLPSSTFMMAWLAASAVFLLERHFLFAAIAIICTLSTGWPFGVVVLVPLGIRVLRKEYRARGVWRLLLWSVGVTAAVEAAVLMIDHKFYGVWLSPTWNIFKYNAAGGGDELYGIEPTSYYIKNLFLNLNLLAPMGIIGLPVLVFSRNQPAKADLVTMIVTLYTWLAITVPRPHKEERFLFPIYPVLVLSSVLTVDHTLNFIGRIVAGFSRHKTLVRNQRIALHCLVWLPVVAMSLCRVAALHKYYTAPLQMYAALVSRMDPLSNQLVCTCGEWYRFPSSFYLPKNHDLGFLPSSFGGQLPQAFSVHGSLPKSLNLLQPFNDQNQQEMSRYATLDQCNYIVDLEGSDCAPSGAEVVARAPFLDGGRSSMIHRMWYLPILHDAAIKSGSVQYEDYVLYKT